MLHPSQSACCFVEEPCGARPVIATRRDLGCDGGCATGPDSLRLRTDHGLHLGRVVSVMPPRSSMSARKGSATDQACAQQPRGW